MMSVCSPAKHFLLSNRGVCRINNLLKNQSIEINWTAGGGLPSPATSKQQVFGATKSTCQRRLMSTTSSQEVKSLRFDGQTAIVTGGARGLGREYVLLLASRGANVVVNDFGGSRSGDPIDSKQQVANDLVSEIKSRFPEAKVVANSESVNDPEGVERLVKETMSNFGRIDILINNAGILRDKSFAKMTIADWDEVIGVHLRGSFLVSHACWPIMRQQSYGKIIMTSSTSGLFGNFGQANYAAAKMGLIGLSNTLAIEGKRNNISCNVIVPMAYSRMTQDIIPEEVGSRLQASYVAPMVAWLCHSSCQASGRIIEASGGWYGEHRLLRSRGCYLAPSIGKQPLDVEAPEQVASNWQDGIAWLSKEEASQLDSFGEHLAELVRVFESK